ncbi:Zinc/iron permease [Thermus sp. CCB_US3_UF1]|uniref:ZIP family metal transporter n=1 Tax=Thermus sp. CCB_US3_UF1 TaxID=1111069 RepID=UPI0002389AC2|nr:ZIP family metal transporter [Thermus sp. CCB_US3_UF1]AEV15357.1 Zinc/iron permease [Thermus sp. CCB_US3_UF1]
MDSPLLYALLGGVFTWGLTAVGAASVFLWQEPSRKLLDGLLGFAAGVMLAASVFSLLLPGMEIAQAQGMLPWVPAVVGFLLGGGLLRLLDRFLPHLHLGPGAQEEGLHTAWRRTTLLILAITLHNFPEGLAVGVAFGAAGLDPSGAATLGGAVALAMGIGLQNLPEGLAVAWPLRRAGIGAGRAWFYGQLSAIVEPLGAVLGALLVAEMQALLPYLMALAAGAMVFVIVEEVIPESQSEGNGDTSTFGVMVGFALMMALDVALG